jgi:phosphate transport system substrate-binding protein
MEMKMKKTLLAVALMGIFGVAQAQTVRIDGSSTVYPITEGVAEDFQKETKIRVTVGVSGTGGGFKKFCRGEIDVANASRPITQNEIADCAKQGIKFYEMPVAFDAMTVVIHPKNTFVKQLTIQQLRKMWEPAAQGKITRWNQIDPTWPNQRLSLFGPGADSGTFEYFTEAVNGKSKASRGDFTASEDDNILVKGVSTHPFGLGYFGYAYYEENKSKVKAVPIVNKDGVAVYPNEKSVMDGTYNPLARPIFIYVKEDSLKQPHVRRFVEFYMKNVSRITKEIKFVPLPDKVYIANLKHIENNRVGTVFGGHNKVGMTIEELVNAEVK